VLEQPPTIKAKARKMSHAERVIQPFYGRSSISIKAGL
jgi:hypothetical protein